MSRAKDIGTAWESRAGAYYADVLGTPVRRLAQHGARDLGDLDGVYLHAVEAKAHMVWQPLEWVRQAQAEAANKNVPFHVVLAKRPRLATPHCMALSTLDNHARLVRRLRDAEDALARTDPAIYRDHIAAHDNSGR